ncbi:MAG TPA: beta-ketoacyl synthase N-terminal-like domain-containing protein [Polyangiaceae bacterium]|nr:beta-ketoacyl synthase N-terminal-like domain-containing protein [Polyangiaceae bacterium]
MSGLPAHLAAAAVGFGGDAFALDAACASSLYALKLASLALHDGRADLALAGGVNHADDLFLHGGFSALRALSPTGQSRPFHREADGLVPAQGAALLLLERLDDAVANGRRILGVIRGVGLSNDGRSRGLMVPSEEGQIRALRAAYAESGLSPSDISLVECHATGTGVGDGAEIRSMRAVFEGARGVPIGSLKSNVGHLITASGAAAVIKVLAAMREQVRPPTRHADAPLDELADGAFRLLREEEPWGSPAGTPRRAAISNFGFGGNNAHLLLEEWLPGATSGGAGARSDVEIAVVARAVRAGSATEELREGLLTTAASSGATAKAATIELDAGGLRFPPNDLRASLPQQTWLLAMAKSPAMADALARLPKERTSVLIGMQTDAEVARHAVRWRGVRRWVDALPTALARDGLTGASVIGCMPNIVANRLSHQLDVRGPSYTVSSEERSGLTALAIGARALRAGEIDAAVVGAVDLACEPVAERAAREVLPASHREPGDAAVLLVCKRHADAVRDGDPVLALLTDDLFDGAEPTLDLALTPDSEGLTPRFGHAHAASGLLHVAAAIEACARRALPSAVGPMPWLPTAGTRRARVRVASIAGDSTTYVEAPPTPPTDPIFLTPAPELGLFGAVDVAALIASVESGRTLSAAEASALPASALRLAVVAEDPREYAERLARAAALLRALPPAALASDATAALDEGVHFGRGPLEGELAFVFTGAAGAYPHMGRDLALAFPELVDSFGARAASVRDAAGWVYDDVPDRQTTPLEKLWGASYLGQLHTELTRGTFGLEPTAAIGYCSGETNSLFALGAWTDLDGFRSDVAETRVYDRWLCGELACLRPAWNLDADATPEWATWRVRAPIGDVRAALEGETRAHLVIINSPTDMVFSGEPEACARVGAKLGRRAVRTPGYDFVMHCPEAREFESRWRALHTRPTISMPWMRFYTHASLSSYVATTETAADALTGQAMNLVDFPALVERAWADGVRVFIEHGPHAGCTKWIDEVLGERPHVAIALDRYGRSSLLQAAEAAARLFAAGAPVALESILARLARGREAPPARSAPTLLLSLPAHPDAVPRTPPRMTQELPMMAAVSTPSTPANGHAHQPAPLAPSHDEGEYMAPPPMLASVGTATRPAPPSTPAPRPIAPARRPASPVARSAVAQAPHLAPPHPSPHASPPPLGALTAHHARLAELHTAFMRQQIELQARFVDVTLAPLGRWARGGADASPHADDARHEALVAPAPGARPTPVAPVPAPTPAAVEAPRAAPVLARSAAPAPSPAKSESPLAKAPPTQALAAPAKAPEAKVAPRAATPRPRTPTGPTFDRAGLEIHASGEISKIFGDLFRQQDGYARQVRMPEPPLLLADRVLGIEGTPGTLGLGTIWTETDVTPGAWYLHEGRMPAGLLVESGQADLMLISWLGADFLNRGERVYRLLGCELKSHGPLPTLGDTLHYEILVDGHAEQNGIRLFFFHYNCWVNGELRMSVRSGQAGFFTDEELAGSAGVLWSPEAATPVANPRLDPPRALSSRRAFSRDQITAFVEGRLGECFGPELDHADSHTRTPTIAGGKMRLLDEVTAFEPNGGPWGRGYLRAVLSLTPEHWFFDGHFKNDPCMPGTLMLEGGLQAMQILMTALGHTLDHDGSRFEPVPEENYSLRCRGQAVPTSKEVVYEIFVEEVVGGLTPTLYADILGTVDGRKAFHCKRMALRLVPAWPLDAGRLDVPALREAARDPRPVAVVDGFRFDYASLLACAWGVPSSAFGPMYARFDGTRRVARLPGPPYHFMSRVTSVTGRIGGMEVGSVAVIDYDVPADEWYFTQNNARAMPFPVMLETALQPCGWLASYTGGALDSEDNLYFRNLDGTGTQHVEITPDVGTLTVTTKLTSISKADAIVIMGFDVVMTAGERVIYTLKTVFGFFPGDTMKDQAGLPMTPAHRARLVDASDHRVELGDCPARYFGGSLRLPEERLVMIDRLTGLWREGELAGKAGLGRLRAEKDVAARQWFFKAHFYQDPVQPGSLGIEALLQALQALVIELDLGRGLAAPRFETQAAGVTMSWKYRGQVIPSNHVVVVDVELTEVRDEVCDGVPARVVVAEGSLWVDGKRIYEAKGLAVRLVATDPTTPAA